MQSTDLTEKDALKVTWLGLLANLLLALAKDKMRDRLAVLGHCEPLAGGLGVGGGLDGPLGLGGKREQQ